jgi:hypothetical protein
LGDRRQTKVCRTMLEQPQEGWIATVLPAIFSLLVGVV